MNAYLMNIVYIFENGKNWINEREKWKNGNRFTWHLKQWMIEFLSEKWEKNKIKPLIKRL